MYEIKRVAPEQAGVPSRTLIKLIRRLQDEGIIMHSILVMRHDQLILEAYYKPYDAQTPHRMYSVTKSLCSLAVSFLLDEGLVELDDRICEYFPEYLPQDASPWLTEMTIRDMLEMRTCHCLSTYKADLQSNWVRSFFTTVPDHPAGRIYHYDTSATHTLAALVERLSGMSLLDYLRVKMLDEMGLSASARILIDPFGVSMGGSGLMMTPEDALKFGSLLLHGGKWNGKQLVNPEYIKQATSKQVDTAATTSTRFTGQGYGWQFWQVEHGGFGCFGMGGQLIICYPEQDIVLVITADTQSTTGGEQRIFDAFYGEVFANLSDNPLQENMQDYHKLQELVEGLEIAPLQSGGEAPEGFQSGRVYRLRENEQGFKDFCVSIDGQGNGELAYTSAQGRQSVPFGIGRMVTGRCMENNHLLCNSGAWLADGTLFVKCHVIDEQLGSVRFQCSFGKDDIVIWLKKIVEYYYPQYDDVHLYGE